MYQSQTVGELAAALAAAQAELKDAEKSSENPHFKSKYADLATVLQTVRPVLSAHGLAVLQLPGSYSKETGTVQLSTLLIHKSGEFVGDALYVPVSKPDAQGIGAAITYGRRYALAAICGIAQDDDDGETAVGRGEKTKAKAKPATAPSPGVSGPTMTEAELIAALQGADAKAIPGFAPHFAALDGEAQGRVLPHLKAARERLKI